MSACDDTCSECDEFLDKTENYRNNINFGTSYQKIALLKI